MTRLQLAAHPRFLSSPAPPAYPPLACELGNGWQDYLSRSYPHLRSRTSEFGDSAIGIVHDLMAGQSARGGATVIAQGDPGVLSYDIDIEIYQPLT